MSTGTLGGLLVSLALDTAQYTAGLNKAEQDAKRMANEYEALMTRASLAGNVLGDAIAKVVTTTAELVKGFLELGLAIGKYQQIATRTGADPAGLASMRTAADVAEVSMDTVAMTMTRMTRTMSMARNEATPVGRAFKELGLNLADIKKLAPEQQMKELAKALSDMPEGANKVAIFSAISGGSRGSYNNMLVFMKELAKENENSIGLTNEQIRLANELTDSHRATMSIMRQYAEYISAQFLPAISDVTAATYELVKQFLGLGSATKLDGKPFEDFADGIVDSLAGIIDFIDHSIKEFQRLKSFGEQLIGLTNATAVKPLAGIAQWGAEQGANFRRWLGGAPIDLPTAFNNNSKLAPGPAAAAVAATRNDRRIRDAARGLMDTLYGAGGDGGITSLAGEPGANRLSEGEKLLKSLEDQVLKTNQLTKEEELRTDPDKIAALEQLGGFEQAVAIAYARQIDQVKILKDAELAQLAAEKFQLEDLKEGQALKEKFAASRAADVAKRYDEIDAIVAGNKALEEEIELIGKDARQKEQIENLRIQAIINRKQEQIEILKGFDNSAAEVQNAEDYIAQLKKRQNLLTIKTDVTQFADKEEAKTRTQAMSDSIADGILDGFRRGESFADVFVNELKAQFAKTILRPILSPVVNAGNSVITKLLGNLANLILGDTGFGSVPGGYGPGANNPSAYVAPGAGGGPVGANSLRRVNELRTEGLMVNGEKFLLMGNQGGVIDSMPRGASAPTVVQYNTIGDGVGRNDVAAGLVWAKEQAKAEIMFSMRTGGAFAMGG